MANEPRKTTRPSDATQRAEERDEAKSKDGGPVPTPEEEAAAERATVSDAAKQEYRDYLDKAKDAKGEGRIP